MPRKRSTYTAEFKLQAVRMITDQKLAVAEVARHLLTLDPDLFVFLGRHARRAAGHLHAGGRDALRSVA